MIIVLYDSVFALEIKLIMKLIKQKSIPILTQLVKDFTATRELTEKLSIALTPEDASAQSATFASPAKWHLAHTSWFFEKFLLKHFCKNYCNFNDSFNHLFNSYYNSAGSVYSREHRGLLTRPSLDTVYEYRNHINKCIIKLLESCDRKLHSEVANRILLGINHEQQHQELLLTDIKHLFWHNPLLPNYHLAKNDETLRSEPREWIEIGSGIYEAGADHECVFAFDNETPNHRVFLNKYEISSKTVTNKDYLDFIEDRGYQNPMLWLSDGWNIKNKNGWDAPLYWSKDDKNWSQFTLGGVKSLNLAEPVCHLSFYEADAYARWAGYRLPTEIELEVACQQFLSGNHFLESEKLHPSVEEKDFNFMGNVWEWTNSSYLPYPGFSAPEGALGEYNGKFMINQMVLKGGSCLTPKSHIRSSYRNFFYPQDRWQMTGLRVVKN